jgi:transposase InsO family protein
MAAAIKAPSSCYFAGDTGSFACDIGLEPRTTPIESPRSNGMAEAFVHTIARDHVRVRCTLICYHKPFGIPVFQFEQPATRSYLVGKMIPKRIGFFGLSPSLCNLNI